MGDWYERLLNEIAELEERKAGLKKHLEGDTIKKMPVVQVALLTIQLNAMETYHSCLEARIEDINKQRE